MGNMQNLNGWDKFAEGIVKGNGDGVATLIPYNLFTTAVNMSKYGTQAFYITLRSSSILYSKLENGIIIATNEDLQITSGYGVGGYPLLNVQTYYPRAWNGHLHYRLVHQ